MVLQPPTSGLLRRTVGSPPATGFKVVREPEYALRFGLFEGGAKGGVKVRPAGNVLLSASLPWACDLNRPSVKVDQPPMMAADVVAKGFNCAAIDEPERTSAIEAFGGYPQPAPLDDVEKETAFCT
jgi:hypothetical protein